MPIAAICNNRLCLLCMTILLSACGGGAVSGDSEDPGGLQPPANPQHPGTAAPAYSGKQDPMTLTPFTVRDAVSLMLISRGILLDSQATLTEQLSGRPGDPFIVVIEGAVGGSVEVSGEGDWVHYEYDAFDDGNGVVVDGGLLEEISDDEFALIEKTIAYHDLTYSDADGVTRLAGTLNVTEEQSSDPTTRFHANFTMEATALGGTLWFDDLEISFESTEHSTYTGENEFTIRGRIYHSALGYIDISPPDWRADPWVWSDSDRYGPPQSGDALHITGTLPIRVRVLNEHFAGVEFDADSDERYERGARYTWDQLTGIEDWNTGSLEEAPVAVAAATTQTTGSILLSGLYSAGSGAGLLEYKWELLESPYVSQRPWVADTPVAFFNVPNVGEYLFRLTVTSESGSSSDTVRARVVDDYWLDDNTVGGIGHIETPATGETVTLDPRTHDSSIGRFYLDAPAGSLSALSVGDTFTELTPDVPGVYHLALRGNGNIDSVLLYVETGFDFHPPVSIPPNIHKPLEADSFNLANLDDDDLPEIIKRKNAAESGEVRWTALDVYRDPPILGSIPNADSNTFTVFDYYANGYPDIVSHGWDSVRISRSEHSHSTGNCDALSNDVIAAGDVNGDGNDDLVASVGCPGLLDTHLGNSSTGLATPIPWATGRIERLALADLNGDGRDDLIAAAPAGELDLEPAIATAISIGDGTFQPFAIVAAGGDEVPYFGVGNVNDDAYVDIVTTAAGQLEVIQPDGVDEHAMRTVVPVYPDPRMVSIADINNDGLGDIVVVHGSPASSLGIVLQAPDGGWLEEVLIAAEHLDLVAEDSRPVQAADMNGDGKTDLVFTNGDKGVSIMLAR